MPIDRESVERLMKRCQIGVGGRNALDTAHDIMAECYGTLGALIAENERLRAAMGVAYGYLWCVNNEPGTPNQYPPEKAAYQARKVLRGLLTQAERGHFINAVVQCVREPNVEHHGPETAAGR